MLCAPQSLSGGHVCGTCRGAATMAKGGERAHVAALVRRLAPGGSAADQAEAARALARLGIKKTAHAGRM
jgi:hypothetical protein